MAPSGVQICNYCKWRHLVGKYATNISGVILLQSLIQVTESISGSVVPLAMFSEYNAKKKKEKIFGWMGGLYSHLIFSFCFFELNLSHGASLCMILLQGLTEGKD